MRFPTLILLAALLSFALSARTQAIELSAERNERAAFIRAAEENDSEAFREEQEAERKFREENPHVARPSFGMLVTELRPFGDWDYYVVKGLGGISWWPNPGQTFKEVHVPSGFVTDLTSVPRLFWLALRPEGRYAFAAVVHDYLYWTQTRSRKEADQIFKLAMEDSKVDPSTVKTVYRLVRRYGQSSWDKNAELKKSGERRMLKSLPEDFTVSWREWKMRPNVFADE